MIENLNNYPDDQIETDPNWELELSIIDGEDESEEKSNNINDKTIKDGRQNTECSYEDIVENCSAQEKRQVSWN